MKYETRARITRLSAVKRYTFIGTKVINYYLTIF